MGVPRASVTWLEIRGLAMVEPVVKASAGAAAPSVRAVRPAAPTALRTDRLVSTVVFCSSESCFLSSAKRSSDRFWR